MTKELSDEEFKAMKPMYGDAIARLHAENETLTRRIATLESELSALREQLERLVPIAERMEACLGYAYRNFDDIDMEEVETLRADFTAWQRDYRGTPASTQESET